MAVETQLEIYLKNSFIDKCLQSSLKISLHVGRYMHTCIRYNPDTKMEDAWGVAYIYIYIHIHLSLTLSLCRYIYINVHATFAEALKGVTRRKSQLILEIDCCRRPLQRHGK